MADAAGVKPESGIKHDPDGGSPMAMDDLNEYEDSGEADLEFYNAIAPDGRPTPEDQLRLAKLPAYLWQAWEQVKNQPDGDAPVQIGKLRVWTEPGRVPGTQTRRTKLLLDATRPEHQGLPKEYDLTTNSTSVDNFFIFSETDLEAFKAKNKERKDAAARGMPMYLLKKKDGQQKPPEDKGAGGRRGGRREFVRRTIPKKTAITGRIREDLFTTAVDNPETEHLLNTRSQAAFNPEQKLNIVDRHDISSLVLQAGTAQASDKFHNFVRAAPILTKREKADMRTARMAQDLLFDKIFALFRRFNYWSMKAIKAEISQPETYLRQTLEQVADLHKSGRFANTWSLKPEHQGKVDNSAAQEQAAPDAQIESTDDDADDDDDEDMEDVPV